MTERFENCRFEEFDGEKFREMIWIRSDDREMS
jgi:hypothetical protein